MIHNIEPGTKEWHEFRQYRIGASDFAVMAAHKGLCPNVLSRSLNSVIKEKINSIIRKDNEYFALGRAYESPLLNSLKRDLIIGEVVSYDKNPRISASLDARDEFANIPIEAKTTSKSAEKMAALIAYYAFQVAHQCYCLGVETGLLVIGILDDTKEVVQIKQYEIIAADTIKKSLWLELCEEFLNTLDEANLAPKAIIKLVDKIQSIDADIKKLTAEKEGLKAQLIEHYPNGCIYKEFNLQKQTKITNSYADYIKDNKIILTDDYKNTTYSYVLRSN